MDIKRNKVYDFFLYGTITIVITLMSCGNSTGQAIGASNVDSLNVPQLSVTDAEDQMFYKISDYTPAINVSLNTEQNIGEYYQATKDYLDEFSITNALVNWINQKTKKPSHQMGLYWDNTPIDTLFFDDFEFDEKGFLGSQKEIIQIIDYDVMWCSIISEALTGEERDQQIVQRCRTNLQNAEALTNAIHDALDSYGNQTQAPHAPLIYVFSFQESIMVYMEHLQREAFYMFTGYAFYDALHPRLLYVVEEFNF